MVLFFNYPQDTDMDDSVMYITRLCDQHSVPMATNVATAEMLITAWPGAIWTGASA